MDEKGKDIALFRLMVLGPLASRGKLSYGELQKTLRELAIKPYCIPYSQHTHLSKKNIERWYYNWLRGGFDALLPKK